MSNNQLSQALPYVSLFYGSHSEYVWYDDAGQAHTIQQAEGGEQGDPLMPGLFALGQHPALEAIRRELRADETLFAFLDDIYLICQPERAGDVFNIAQTALRDHARMEVNLGKTRAWNAAGVEPSGIAELGTADDPCWVGDRTLEPDRQGLLLLGTPLGSHDYVQTQLADKRREHDLLLERIPSVPNLQAAWLLLLFCATPRPNYMLRMLPPTATTAFAAGHDAAVENCLARLLSTDSPPQFDNLQCRRIHLPLRRGGLGLRSATTSRQAAYWASWADSIPVVQQRHPAVAAGLIDQLTGGAAPTTSSREAAQALGELTAEGFHAPSWHELLQGALAPQPDANLEEQEFGNHLRGWQRVATASRDRLDETGLHAALDPASQALLLSQGGAHGGRALTAFPTAPEFTFPDSHFRILLLRRLRMPLPLAARRCRCRRFLDPLGDHRAACHRCGVLGPRGVPLEHAAARVCREAGARVATNVFLRDMNLDTPVFDDRRIEVVANGLPIGQGAQVAIDTTLVCPVRADGRPRPQAAQTPGVALRTARRRKRRSVYPELRAAARCCLAVLGFEVGGRWSTQALDLVRQLAWARARSQPDHLKAASAHAFMYRWSALLAVAAQRAFAASLLELPQQNTDLEEGVCPEFSDFLADARHEVAPLPSRLPAPL